MGRGDGGAEGAGRSVPDAGEVIGAARGAGRDFAFFVEPNVGSEVVGEMDGGAVGETIFQGEFVRGGVELAEVINAGVGLNTVMVLKMTDLVTFDHDVDEDDKGKMQPPGFWFP